MGYEEVDLHKEHPSLDSSYFEDPERILDKWISETVGEVPLGRKVFDDRRLWDRAIYQQERRTVWPENDQGQSV